MHGANDGGSGGAGGAGGEGAPAGTPPPAPVPVPLPVPVVVPGTEGFTAEQQAQVNAISAREKAEGKRAAAREVQELLGCTPEEAKKIIDDKAAADLAAMSESDRLKAEATADRAKAAAELATAGLVSIGSQVTAAIVAAGVSDPDATKQAKRLADIAMLVRVPADTPADQLPAAITAAVAAVKTDYPGMFITAGTGPTPPSHGGGGPGPGAASNAGQDALQRGAERAKAMAPAPVEQYDSNPFA